MKGLALAARTCARPGAAGGFTLLELLMAMVVLGILVAIAVPNYTRFVARANRSNAKVVLVDLASRQESYFLQAHTYASTFDPLIATTTSSTQTWIDNERKLLPSLTSAAIYQLDLVANCTSTCGTGGTAPYCFQATPQNNQVANDSQCGTLCLTSTGQQSVTGTATDCWER